jgi:hypothetical protein
MCDVVRLFTRAKVNVNMQVKLRDNWSVSLSACVLARLHLLHAT